MGVTIARYVYQNSVIKRLTLAVFDVLRVPVARYVLLVLLEKPANEDRKSEFPNKPIHLMRTGPMTVLPKIQNKSK